MVFEKRLDQEKKKRRLRRHIAHQNASISGWWKSFAKTSDLFEIFNNKNALPFKSVLKY